VVGVHRRFSTGNTVCIPSYGSDTFFPTRRIALLMASLESTPQYTCRLCSKEISLETCKTDDRGRLVHEFCYSLSLRLAADPDAVLEYMRLKSLEGMRRSWKEVAMDVLGETNRQRFRDLAEELDDALAARELVLKDPSLLSGISDRIAYEKTMNIAVNLMRSDYASLQMLYPERGTGGELRLLAFRGFNPQAARFWEWVRADSQSTCGIALRDGERVVASDIAACDFMADSEDQHVYLQTGIHACQTTPLITRAGNLVGMISTHWRSRHQPSENDLSQFDILARQAADLLEHSRSFERTPQDAAKNFKRQVTADF
jgi:GAF domain-containing protein